MPGQASGRAGNASIAGPFRVTPDSAINSAINSASNSPSIGAGGSLREAAGRGAAARAQLLARCRPLAGSYVTIRGAMAAMFGIFLVCCLAASWLNLTVLIGLGYAASCAAAPFFVRRSGQLHVVIAPPAIFLAAVIISQVLTAQGASRHGRVVSVVEGTLLTLAAVAPWLFAGTALGAGVATTRGLGTCVREAMAVLRAEPAAGQASRREAGARTSPPADIDAARNGTNG